MPSPTNDAAAAMASFEQEKELAMRERASGRLVLDPARQEPKAGAVAKDLATKKKKEAGSLPSAAGETDNKKIKGGYPTAAAPPISATRAEAGLMEKSLIHQTDALTPLQLKMAGSSGKLQYEGYLQESEAVPFASRQQQALRDSRPGAFPYSPPPAGLAEEQAQVEQEEQQEDPHAPDPGPRANAEFAALTAEQTGGSDGLAVATMVDSSPFMVQADEVDPEDLTEQTRKSSNRAEGTKQFAWAVGTMLLVLLVAALTLIIVFTTQGNKEEAISGPPNPPEGDNSTSLSNLSPEEQLLQSLLPDFTLAAIQQDDTSPQSLAFQWLLSDTDHFHLYPNWRLLQRYILATLFFSTGGPTFWRESTGWLDYNLHECQWWSQATHSPPGITKPPKFTDADGTPLFPYMNHCSLPPDVSANLTVMSDAVYTDLWLWGNNLVGDLPREVFLLPSLRSYGFVVNPGLTGAITSDIGQLPGLLGGTFSRTGLSFTIPTEIGKLSNFGVIHGLRSKLYGTLPTELGLLSRLQWLRVDETLITGTIPSQLGLMTDTNRLILGNTGITGTIPTQLGQLTKMLWLDIRHADVTGTIPSELGLISSLKVLRLEESELGGSVPAEILALPNLVALNLTGNEQLTGEVPFPICGEVPELGFTCEKYQ